MEVVASHLAADPIKLDVVKPFKASAVDLLDPVVRNQEILLPAHKHRLARRKGVSEVSVGTAKGASKVLRGGRGQGERRELGPMVVVNPLGSTPTFGE